MKQAKRTISGGDPDNNNSMKQITTFVSAENSLLSRQKT